MIEIIRFSLAIVVVEAHIWPLGAAWLAWAAVFAFYTLSGFLMTRVLNERYGFLPTGVSLFAMNRILRLGPAYFVCAIIGLIVIVAGMPILYVPQRLPETITDFVTNLFVVGQVGFSANHLAGIHVLVPNAWSLSIELVCYLLLAVFFARSSARLILLALIGAVMLTVSTKVCLSTGWDGQYCFQSRYTVLQAGFIPFAIGGLVYFNQHQLVALSGKIKVIAAVCLMLLVVACFRVGGALQFTVAPFIGSMATVVILSVKPSTSNSSVVDFLGRSSYHQFLAHWSLASILLWLLPFSPQSFPLFVATVGFGLVLSAFLVPFERRVDNWRRRRTETLGAGEYPRHSAPLASETRVISRAECARVVSTFISRIP
jgi:peptidoglycan/LPS O-acetylase OafA/YrhL